VTLWRLSPNAASNREHKKKLMDGDSKFFFHAGTTDLEIKEEISDI
jgi:hypothetical protein